MTVDTLYIRELYEQLTVEYDPSPNTLPKSKSCALIRPLTELFLERGWAAAGICGGFSSPGLSSSSRVIPSSRARYAGPRDPRGVFGEPGLLERIGR